MEVFPEDPELLVVAAAEPTMATLIEGLDEHGIHADLVHALPEARNTFLARGGHRLLVLAPDLPPAVAREIAASLLRVDPTLSVIAFGKPGSSGPAPPGSPRRILYHPSSRAAVGAVLKALHNL
jgi:hypothetical protein